jgi:hypothetical protein
VSKGNPPDFSITDIANETKYIIGEREREVERERER